MEHLNSLFYPIQGLNENWDPKYSIDNTSKW